MKKSAVKQAMIVKDGYQTLKTISYEELCAKDKMSSYEMEDEKEEEGEE
jgi:hypothetical protein